MWLKHYKISRSNSFITSNYQVFKDCMLNFKAVGALTILGLIGLILNVVYYILQVDYFGINREIEVYFVALSLTGLGITVLLAGQIGPMALPLYLDKKEIYGSKIADEIFSVIINWMVFFSIPVVLILYYFAPIIIQLIVPGFDQTDQNAIQSLFLLLIFSTPFHIINILSNNLLNAQNIYGRIELINILRIIISIIVLVLLFEKLGIYTLILSYWLEVILNLVFNIFLLIKIKFNYQLRISSSGFNHFKFFKQTSIAYLSSGSSQLYNFILTASVSFLPAGIYAIFKYTETILMKISAIVVMPINTVFFTAFAEDFSKKSKALNLRIEEAINFGLLLSVLILSLSVSFGNDILAFLWGTNFSTVNQEIAFSFFILNIITLLFFTIKNIFFRVSLVYKLTFFTYLGQAVAWLLATAYAYFVIKHFKTEGLGSVIIFISLCHTIISFFVIYNHDKKISTVFNFNYFAKLIFLFLCSLLMGYLINQLAVFNFDFNTRLNTFLNLLIKGLLIFPPILLLLKLMKIDIVTR